MAARSAGRREGPEHRFGSERRKGSTERERVEHTERREHSVGREGSTERDFGGERLEHGIQREGGDLRLQCVCLCCVVRVGAACTGDRPLVWVGPERGARGGTGWVRDRPDGLGG